MQKNNNIKQFVADAFLQIADSIESGQYKEKIKIGLTILGSEHGVENLIKGAELAAARNQDVEIVLIGPKMETELEIVDVNSEEEMHGVMEKLLDENYIQACITHHYNFPIGVSTVGKVNTPALGREMFLATTTGTSSVNRSEAMFRNALYGIVTAKSTGIKEPSVGILNLDGARQVERALKELDSNGYPIKFAESMRSDGGTIMRGNDLLCGTADVMVTDTLTGNIMMKVFSSYTTGGSYEAMGYGYGPGVGDNYKRLILILSRASGIPVIANSMSYAIDLVRGAFHKICEEEFKKARKAGLDRILESFEKEDKKSTEEDVTMPEKETVTEQITGIDIMDLEDAVKVLWKAGIYAESGMGCTGPIVRINEKKIALAVAVLSKEGFS